MNGDKEQPGLAEFIESLLSPAHETHHLTNTISGLIYEQAFDRLGTNTQLLWSSTRWHPLNGPVAMFATQHALRLGRNMNRILLLILVFCASRLMAAETDDRGLPQVPDGFRVSVYAREPLVRNPCAMAFDAQGRLFVGQGPQYRKPKPDSPTDRVTLLIDADQDGIADHAKTFAEGFNSIQGLAWYGDQLWIANAPDLTVVRDVDGDDVADEYRRVYGGLGNLEHALHGLTFAPDGWLYMSKGNSKGYRRASSPERFVAPAPFIDLWGVRVPKDSPTSPESDVFSRETYQHGYHNPSDDWT